MSSNNGVKAADRPESKVCNVSECDAWKTGEIDFCYHHKGMAKGNAEEGNQRAMKTGVNSDPVNLFDYLAENEESGLAYILNKLWEYSTRAPHPVFEVDVSKEDIDCFDDADTALTAYGDDVLLMCIRDYVRWRGSRQQLKEGLTTEQWRSGENGEFQVTDANPVNLELDRMDKTTMQQKDKLGLMPSPESEKADATRELAELWAEDLS